MAIRFTAEGGFREVPDRPKPKYFSYPIINGPSKTELFNAVKFYPDRKVAFRISQGSPNQLPFELPFSCLCEIFVSGIRVLLVPTESGGKITIDKINNHWLGEGFFETPQGFVGVNFGYNIKE